MSRVPKIAATALAGGLMLGIAPQAGAILYAENATSPLAESTALLIIDGERYCTGTVIDEKKIVSADHCFDEDSTGIAHIGGEADGEPIEFSSVSIYPGPEDVAVVNLDEATTAQPVELYEGEDYPGGTEGTAFGWGGHFIEGVGPFGTIQQASGIQEDGRFEVTPRVDQDSIGFKLDQGAITPGDSGGPVFVDGKLYGILSMFSPPESTPGDPNTGWYSAVSDTAEWLMDTSTPVDPEPSPDPTEPTDTPDPTEPTDTPDPTEPTDTPAPTKPTKPTKPTDTPDPTTPTDTPDPIKPTSPPVKPAPPAAEVPAGQAPSVPVNDTTEYGPKVETGGKVNQSWVAKVASIFR